jgi:glycosyltransferase involved in cell wall biosynthesis
MVVEPAEGGTAEVVAALAAHLPGHGYEVEIAGPLEAPRYPGAHRLPLRPGYGSPRDDAAAAIGLAKLLRRRRPDLVHTHSAKAGVIGRPIAAALRIPVVHSPHCFPFLSLQYSARRRKVAETIERALAPVTRTILCVAEDERREALAHRIAKPAKLAVVHNGVPACAGAAVPAALSSLDRPVAATVSVLREQKRVDVFLSAAPLVLEKLPDARLAVIGNGPLLGELRAQADPRVTFIPFAPPMEGWLSGLDCFVLSSDYEAFPVAIVEALACGTPQVATDVGGAREAVTADTGVLVPPGDPVALAEAIVEVLANPGGRGAASRARHATLFGLDRMVAGTAQVYAGALRA